ncbi:MAG TPA: protein-L-isoaspartate(D-aspartate) O-methyltransferase [Gemmataceae bacterium]|jgi:protein-L-isoaspartate(D-aspartate) O-methyltransferase|nr:protein-L-isoaspartate(D-aspartate) O-methyltransferase [Gemmataceae bacterium]
MRGQTVNALIASVVPNHRSRWLLLLVLLCLAPGANRVQAQTDAQWKAQRLKMVDVEIAKEGITNESVLDALRVVPRHLFVPEAQRARSYLDAVLPIGYQQTISPPYIVAYMTEVLDPQKDDKVLEIGTGSGYQAAVLAEICKEVYSIEIVPQLGNSAAKRLKALGYDKVQVKVGDGYKGWAEHAPFDKIIVTCSPESVPQPLADQLKEGGRMIVPLGERYQQVFVLLEKKNGKLERTKLVPTFFVAMTGQAEKNRGVLPDGIPHLTNGGFEKNTNFLPDNWYCKRQVTVSKQGAPEGNSFAQFFNNEPGRGSCLYQGMSADGKKVKSIKVTAQILGKDIEAGPDGKNELAGISLIFLDSTFNMLSMAHLGPYHGSFPWRKVSKEFSVPTNAQVVVIRIGLNGATGIFGVDDVRVEPTLK